MRTAEALAQGRKVSKPSKHKNTPVTSRKTRANLLDELMQLLKLDPVSQSFWRKRFCEENRKMATGVLTHEACLRCGKSVPAKRKRSGEGFGAGNQRKKVKHSKQ